MDKFSDLTSPFGKENMAFLNGVYLLRQILPVLEAYPTRQQNASEQCESFSFCLVTASHFFII